MYIEEVVKTAARHFLNFDAIPDIGSKSLKGCKDNLAPDADPNTILFVYIAGALARRLKGADGGIVPTTGMASDGKYFFFTNRKGKPQSFLLCEIVKITFEPYKEGKADTTYAYRDKIVAESATGEYWELEECLLGLSCTEWTAFMESLVQTAKDSDGQYPALQIISLEAMSPGVKEKYLKILCNYAYLNDGQISTDEISLIQSIAVRIEADAQTRLEMRTYMSDVSKKIKTGVLVKPFSEELSYGGLEVLRFSLMQEILYLHEKTQASVVWSDDGFVNSIQASLAINDEQISLMLYALALHREQLAKNVNLPVLQKKIEKMHETAKQLQIPLVSLYCAGSVYNVDTYHGLKKWLGMGEKAINKQRELILQAVVRNSQETVNHLVEDLNAVAQQLIEAIQKGGMAQENIKKLAGLLGRYMQSAKITTVQTESSKIQMLYSELPQKQTEAFLSAQGENTKFLQYCYPNRIENGEFAIAQNMTYETLMRLKRVLGEEPEEEKRNGKST
ncbi:MAG: hypothetical protein RR415_02825 [Ruthenibacterium sp.]